MIEKVCVIIIQELGATGLLVVGLYFIFFKHLEKISKHIEIINHNSTKICEIIERCSEKLCDSVDDINKKVKEPQ
jgi:hypothetical protein